MNQELGGRVISQHLQEAAILAGCSWPYRVAGRLLAKLSGACISAEEIRLLTNSGGKERAAQHQQEAEQACKTSELVSASGVKEQDPLLVGLDGGWVCSREQRGGMEGKVTVICSQMEDLPMSVPSTTFCLSQAWESKTSTKTETSTQWAALRGNLWPIQADWAPCLCSGTIAL